MSDSIKKITCIFNEVPGILFNKSIITKDEYKKLKDCLRTGDHPSTKAVINKIPKIRLFVFDTLGLDAHCSLWLFGEGNTNSGCKSIW